MHNLSKREALHTSTQKTYTPVYVLYPLFLIILYFAIIILMKPSYNWLFKPFDFHSFLRYELSPLDVESFIVQPGERFDFVIEADQITGNYWVRAETLEIDVVNHIALAIFRYQGAEEEDPSSQRKQCKANDRYAREGLAGYLCFSKQWGKWFGKGFLANKLRQNGGSWCSEWIDGCGGGC